MEPKGAQGGPNRAKRSTKEGQRESNGVPKGPLAPKREFKGSLYTQKLPINRPMRPICYIRKYIGEYLGKKALM